MHVGLPNAFMDLSMPVFFFLLHSFLYELVNSGRGLDVVDSHLYFVKFSLDPTPNSY